MRFSSRAPYSALVPRSSRNFFDGRVDLDLERAAAEARVDVLLQVADVLVEDRRQRLLVERLVGDDDVDAVDELGRVAAPHRGDADVLELAGELDRVAIAAALEAEVRLHLLHHLARAEVAREEDEALLEVDGGVVAERQRRAIEDAEQQRRERRRRLLDLVEQHDRDRALRRDGLRQLLLGQDRLRLAMAEVARRRADELGDLVVRLELAAVDLDDLLLAAVQHLGQRLDGPRLAGAGRAEQQEDADGPPFRVQPRLIHLDVRDDALHRGRLADDLAREHVHQVAVARHLAAGGNGSGRFVRGHEWCPDSRLAPKWTGGGPGRGPGERVTAP